MANDFLAGMADASRARCEKAMARVSINELRNRIANAPPPPPLRLDRFDLIAEVKHVSPAEGLLSDPSKSNPEASAAQARLYADAGAAAISVLTEPARFGGGLAHMAAVADAVTTPMMRKDFLVDPYQVVEARAHRASGVLLIARMLSDTMMAAMTGLARELGMFVLLEAFDEQDLVRINESPAARWGEPLVLVGLNCRDLRTLEIHRERFETMRDYMPPGLPWVAESGIHNPEDAAWVAGLGYRLALVGTSLMKSGNPSALAAAMLANGRGVAGPGVGTANNPA